MFIIRWIIKWAVLAGAVILAAYLVPGITIVSWQTALLAAAILGLINVFIKPIKTIDNVREYTENLIAAGLESIQGNKTVDKGEKILVDIVLKAVEAKTGVKVPEDIKKGIQDGVVSGLDKANVALVKQLRK